jgi:hypothetical protein
MVRVLRNLLVGTGCMVLPVITFGGLVGWIEYGTLRRPDADLYGYVAAGAFVAGFVLLWWVNREIYRWRRRR